MKKREVMEALLKGDYCISTPQWIMGFANNQTMENLVPLELQYDGYARYPKEGEYSFLSMGSERLKKEMLFNEYIDRCAFPIGWGANDSFGHAGPGEFNCKVITKNNNSIVVQYETLAKKEIYFNPHNTRVLDLPIKNECDFENLSLPDSSIKERYTGFYKDVAAAKKLGEWTVGWVNGFFSAIHYFVYDYTELLIDLKLKPHFAKLLISKVGNWTLNAAEMMCKAGVDCIGFCDDLGSEASLLFHPEIYREFFWPWHRKLCDLAHSYNTVVHMHSHGNIMPVLKDIAEAGIDILNPLDPDENMLMDQVREVLGGKVVICGGMNKHFYDWEKDKQLEYLQWIIGKGIQNWPHILMDSGGIPDNVSKDWFNWFLDVSREVRKMNR